MNAVFFAESDFELPWLEIVNFSSSPFHSLITKQNFCDTPSMFLIRQMILVKLGLKLYVFGIVYKEVDGVPRNRYFIILSSLGPCFYLKNVIFAVCSGTNPITVMHCVSWTTIVGVNSIVIGKYFVYQPDKHLL